MMTAGKVTGERVGVFGQTAFLEKLDRIRRDYLREGLPEPVSDSAWIALKCAYGREMALADDAGSFGVECIIPSRLGRERRIRHRVIPACREPVMTGYAFLHIEVEPVSLNAVLGLKHAIEIVGGAEKPALISSRQMFDFVFKAECGEYDWHHQAEERFVRGEKVRINAGIFALQTAEVVTIRADGMGDAVVNVTMLGKPHAVTLPIAFLDKV